jgi:hypothetical protein
MKETNNIKMKTNKETTFYQYCGTLYHEVLVVTLTE